MCAREGGDIHDYISTECAGAEEVQGAARKGQPRSPRDASLSHPRIVALSDRTQASLSSSPVFTDEDPEEDHLVFWRCSATGWSL